VPSDDQIIVNLRLPEARHPAEPARRPKHPALQMPAAAEPRAAFTFRNPSSLALITKYFAEAAIAMPENPCNLLRLAANQNGGGVSGEPRRLHGN